MRLSHATGHDVQGQGERMKVRSGYDMSLLCYIRFDVNGQRQRSITINQQIFTNLVNNLVLRHRDHCSRHVETAYVSVMHCLSHSTHSAHTLDLYIESTITPTFGVPDGPQ